MAALLYLLREPIQRIPHALYRADTSDKPIVIGIEQAVQSESPARFAEVISPGNNHSFTTGQALTYGELLQLVIDAGKVITL